MIHEIFLVVLCGHNVAEEASKCEDEARRSTPLNRGYSKAQIELYSLLEQRGYRIQLPP